MLSHDFHPLSHATFFPCPRTTFWSYPRTSFWSYPRTTLECHWNPMSAVMTCLFHWHFNDDAVATLYWHFRWHLSDVKLSLDRLMTQWWHPIDDTMMTLDWWHSIDDTWMMTQWWQVSADTSDDTSSDMMMTIFRRHFSLTMQTISQYVVAVAIRCHCSNVLSL